MYYNNINYMVNKQLAGNKSKNNREDILKLLNVIKNKPWSYSLKGREYSDRNTKSNEHKYDPL